MDLKHTSKELKIVGHSVR